MTAAVALSGGIDSLVAARLLKEQNVPVIGIHFVTGYESVKHGYKNSAQPENKPEAIKDADHAMQRLARQIDIPLHIIDCRQAFEKQIVEYFIQTYRSGRTPNPCVLCNRVIKFGIALEAAQKLGADFVATGHYARVEKTGRKTRLLKGADKKKDQSYFLAMLAPDQLSKAIFPLGSLNKDRVRQIALKYGLEPVSKQESQDICFIHGQNYADFLETRGKTRFEPGPIMDTDGNILGRHKGLHRYTIGQRRGINCPGPAPYYVIRIDPENNRLVVGFKNTLYKKYCYINEVNWLIPKPDEPVAVKARIRYRHNEADAVIYPGTGSSAVIRFAEPQAAVTPGQAAVCYQDDNVVAGGWIVKESMPEL